jgi:hypothetical protein
MCESSPYESEVISEGCGKRSAWGPKSEEKKDGKRSEAEEKLLLLLPLLLPELVVSLLLLLPQPWAV